MRTCAYYLVKRLLTVEWDWEFSPLYVPRRYARFTHGKNCRRADRVKECGELTSSGEVREPITVCECAERSMNF